MTYNSISYLKVYRATANNRVLFTQVATDQVYLAFCAAKSLEQQQQGGNVGAGYKDK